jgi:hypothetical protein
MALLSEKPRDFDLMEDLRDDKRVACPDPCRVTCLARRLSVNCQDGNKDRRDDGEPPCEDGP